jgi:hypothetical protein
VFLAAVCFAGSYSAPVAVAKHSGVAPAGTIHHGFTVDGTITLLTANSIRLGRFSCSLSADSPRLNRYRVGERVEIECGGCGTSAIVARANLGRLAAPPCLRAGDLTSIRPLLHTTDATGMVTRLTSTWIVVPPLKCRVGANLAAARAYRKGDVVTIVCTDGLLTKVFDEGGRELVAKGSIVALSHREVVVANTRCGITSSSPSTKRFGVGARVFILCRNGILTEINRAP